MTAKKFKRVIPGQLEKLKKLLDNCVTEKVHSVYDSFIEGVNNRNDVIGYSSDFNKRHFFTSITVETEQIAVTFIFKSMTDGCYVLFKVYVKSKTSDDPRILFDNIVPFYEKVSYDANMITHFDDRSVAFIEKHFKERIDFNYELLHAYVEWSYGNYEELIYGVSIGSEMYMFNETERQVIDNLISIRSVIES